MIKAILFDIYGTIIKSDAGDLDDSLCKQNNIIKSLNKLKEKYQVNFESETIMKSYFDEIKSDHKEKEKQGIEYPEVQIEKIWEKVFRKNGISSVKSFKQFAYDFYDKCSERSLYKGVKETLKLLKKEGYYIGIVSNAQFYTSKDLKRLLEINDINEIFTEELNFFSYKMGYSKPNPEVFKNVNLALNKKNIFPFETIYIGNSAEKDIQTSNDANIISCLTINPETKEKENINPSYKINKFEDVLKIINEEEAKTLEKNYIFTGTPGTGKTTLAKHFSKENNLEYIDGKEISKEIADEYDEKDECYIIDEKKFSKKCNERLNKKGNVLDSHLSHLTSPELVDYCIISECSQKILSERLKKRDYNDKKIKDNLEAEAFKSSRIEAQEKGHNIIIFDTSIQ
ncbi:MAG: AAA family ATPase [Nanobdellota archaeon]